MENIKQIAAISGSMHVNLNDPKELIKVWRNTDEPLLKDGKFNPASITQEKTSDNGYMIVFFEGHSFEIYGDVNEGEEFLECILQNVNDKLTCLKLSFPMIKPQIVTYNETETDKFIEDIVKKYCILMEEYRTQELPKLLNIREEISDFIKYYREYCWYSSSIKDETSKVIAFAINPTFREVFSNGL